jgi:hypothetical protein
VLVQMGYDYLNFCQISYQIQSPFLRVKHVKN